MTKAEAKALQQEHGMEILRHPITGEAWALYLETTHPIQALDDLSHQDISPCVMEPNYTLQEENHVTYKLICPTSWFDLWGWKD